MTSAGTTRTEQRELAEAPVLSQNLSRVLASGGLVAGRAPRMDDLRSGDAAERRRSTLEVGRREVVRVADSSVVPAFRVEMEFQGLRTTSWMTDTGDVVREESPLGLMTVRESARARAGPGGPERASSPTCCGRRRSCR